MSTFFKRKKKDSLFAHNKPFPVSGHQKITQGMHAMNENSPECVAETCLTVFVRTLHVYCATSAVRDVSEDRIIAARKALVAL
jgi:hypothetical protein